MYQGVHALCPAVVSSLFQLSSADSKGLNLGNQWLSFTYLMKDLPREAKLVLTVYVLRRQAAKHVDQMRESPGVVHPEIKPIGSVNMSLFYFNNRMVQGRHRLLLWEGRRANPIAMTAPSPFGNSLCVNVKFLEPPGDTSIAFSPSPANVFHSLVQGTRLQQRERVKVCCISLLTFSFQEFLLIFF